MSHFQGLIYVMGRFPVRYLLILSMRDSIQQNSPAFVMIFEIFLLIISHFASREPYTSRCRWICWNFTSHLLLKCFSLPESFLNTVKCLHLRTGAPMPIEG